MDNTERNILTAIADKASEYKRLSVDDILKLSKAYKNIYDAEMIKQDIEIIPVENTIERTKEPEIDSFFIGFCD